MLTTAPSQAKSQGRSREFSRHSALLILLVFAVLGSVELIVHLGLHKASRIEGRTESEFRSALAIRSGAGASPTVLVVGSSLLLFAVDFPQFRNLLQPSYTVVRYVIEQTAYLDWYYGLRSLYARGARPDVVVLMLSAKYMASDDLRGDYFAYRMMSPRDTLRVSRDAGLSPTQTFSLFLASFSAYYGTRAETRKFILSKTIPGVRELRTSLIPPPADTFDPKRSTAVVVPRLRQLDDLVRQYGGRFVYAEAPALEPFFEPSIRDAASIARVPVLVPISASDLSPSDFIDGHHATVATAARYTPLLAQSLRQTLKSNLITEAAGGAQSVARSLPPHDTAPGIVRPHGGAGQNPGGVSLLSSERW